MPKAKVISSGAAAFQGLANEFVARLAA